MMEDSETVAAFVPWRCRAREFSLRSTLTIPLGDEGNWRGALSVYAEHPHAFEPAAVVVFEHLAGEISHGLHALRQRELLESERIKRARTQQQLTDALSSMVAALVTAVEMRDPYTAGHEAQVAEIAYAIGKEMGWDEDRLLGLRMASMVHDIGKISIPSEILTKPTKLSAAERALINEHPETGYAILKDIPFIWPIADMMRQHHEKLDGSGYPLGLKAEEILPEAKVLAVADIVDAMAANRPYRHSIALEKVLEEIERQAGHQLDAEVVRVCLKLFREKGFILPHLKHR
jgi:HD-GYP domain-containing protein (c-di-GMP phosphodiesterase class II)